jgi:prolipoprotein diacylglyceryltransferase
LGVLELRQLPRPLAIEGNCEGFFFLAAIACLLAARILAIFSDWAIYSVKFIALISRITNIGSSCQGPRYGSSFSPFPTAGMTNDDRALR